MSRQAAGLDRTDGKGLGVVFADYDDDGRVDLFVANDLVAELPVSQRRQAERSRRSACSPASRSPAMASRAGMGTDFGDYDGDGRLDLVVTNFELETHSMFRNLGGGLFADATAESGFGPATLPFLGFGAAFLDYDNDGDLDLAIANGHVLDNAAISAPTSRYAQRNLLLRNDGRALQGSRPPAGPASR